MRPLVAQPTGIMDPRLQMMSSQFLPANPTAPYSAGGAPQLQLQPQGGISLQQSFMQHNQARGISTTPKIPWTLNKAEKKSYDQIFRAWDQRGEGFITGQTALEVFGQSGLDKNDLAKIWWVLTFLAVVSRFCGFVVDDVIRSAISLSDFGDINGLLRCFHLP